MPILLAHAEDAQVTPHAEGETAAPQSQVQIQQPPPPVAPKPQTAAYGLVWPLAIGLIATAATYFVLSKRDQPKPSDD